MSEGTIIAIIVKKQISIIQPNFQWGPKQYNAYYLPYSAGILWAYCQQFSEILDAYELHRLIWKREDVEELANELAKTDVACFSTYVWNKNYNYALAKRTKELNPDLITIFGGPEVAIEDKKLFEKESFMDIVICLEGEITLKNTLVALEKGSNLRDIPGLLINENGKPYRTEPPERIKDLAEVPSPYLLGLFDDFIKEYDGKIEWNATIETNRGCPYQCTFCDWGSATYSKVRKFGLERVFDEIEWIGKNKCGFLTITDANYGMFLERDHMIADKILEVQEKYGFPKGVQLSWAKNQKAEVLQIVRKLFKKGTKNQGHTVSVQSMEAGVLDIIKRTNLNQHKIGELFALCDQEGIPASTELILGLPNQTLDSWKKSVFDVIRAGNHNGITIHQTQLLENAEMNLFQRKAYKMKSVKVYDYYDQSHNHGEYQESLDVVTSTSTMPEDVMRDAQIFTWFIITFHVSGLSSWVARFVTKYANETYYDFYEKLYEYVKDDQWFSKEEQEMRGYYTQWFEEGRVSAKAGENIFLEGWMLAYRTSNIITLDRRYAYIFDLVQKFVLNTYDIDPEIVEELLQFQKGYYIDWELLKEYPLNKKFKHDFMGYLQYDEPLEKDVTVEFEFRDDVNMDLHTFAEQIYYGRRRLFGKAQMRRYH